MEFAICNRREFASKECVLNTLQKLFTLKILLPDNRTGSLTNAKIVQHILTRPFFFQSLHCRRSFRCAGLVSSYGIKEGAEWIHLTQYLPFLFDYSKFCFQVSVHPLFPHSDKCAGWTMSILSICLLQGAVKSSLG